jgi:hypothetical protein
MSGTAIPQPTPTNPYGMAPALQGLVGGLGGLSNVLNTASGSSANYIRPNPPASFTPGQPNSLLEQILQMRQNLTTGLGQPYQPGVAMPRVSLLQG